MNKNNIIGVIPARLESRRLPHKVLINIEGRSLLESVYRTVIQANTLDKVVIAVDDKLVYDVASSFCSDVYMTSKSCKSGTDRVGEVVKKYFDGASIIINIQADQLFIKPRLINDLVLFLKENYKDVDMCTIATKMSNQDDSIFDANLVKVVTDTNDFVLYFSRAPIPYQGNKKNAWYYKHIGIYGYTREALLKFIELNTSVLEELEGLEQLRALEAGFRIKLLKTDYDNIIDINTEEDLKKLLKIKKWQNIYL